MNWLAAFPGHAETGNDSGLQYEPPKVVRDKSVASVFEDGKFWVTPILYAEPADPHAWLWSMFSHQLILRENVADPGVQRLNGIQFCLAHKSPTLNRARNNLPEIQRLGRKRGCHRTSKEEARFSFASIHNDQVATLTQNASHAIGHE
jgi:hypothetical protein